MSAWTKQKLEQMIRDKIEESPTLDYKAAKALDRKKMDDIRKDATSFANSAGGVIIYGISEIQGPLKAPIPDKLDPIDRTQFSSEWLDQTLQDIQPPISGLRVEAVSIDPSKNEVCYVVEIPQSQTAHQAPDKRYHRRRNFTTEAMEHYEIVDVMSRRTQPKINAQVFFNQRKCLLIVTLENVGTVIARDYMVEFELPIVIGGGSYKPAEPCFFNYSPEGQSFNVKLLPPFPHPPLFPGSVMRIEREMRVGLLMRAPDGIPIQSRGDIKASVFADEMPAIRATLTIDSVLKGWTPIKPDSPAPISSIPSDDTNMSCAI